MCRDFCDAVNDEFIQIAILIALMKVVVQVQGKPELKILNILLFYHSDVGLLFPLMR